MNEKNPTYSKVLLHACCGPCSLEPIRLYREAGIEPTIFFSNSNIAPIAEYELRRDTIKKYCESIDVEFIEDKYDNDMWTSCVKDHMVSKQERCRECYKMRFQRCCNYACYNGFEVVSTTLTISPYQYINVIHEELKKACDEYGLVCGFRDFTEHYYDAQRKAKELGLYRQHYCGCIPSKKEAEKEQVELKKEKQARLEVREAELSEKRAEKRAYADKKARQKRILEELRKRNK